MPFNSAGVYTPASGATTAAPGALIQSSVWNGIFADIITALTSLGETAISTPTTVTASTDAPAAPASIIFNAAGTCTVTLPSAATFSGGKFLLRTIAAQSVISASANVVPLAGGVAGTAILAATAGKWCILQSDGTNWQIMAAN